MHMQLHESVGPLTEAKNTYSFCLFDLQPQPSFMSTKLLYRCITTNQLLQSLEINSQKLKTSWTMFYAIKVTFKNDTHSQTEEILYQYNDYPMQINIPHSHSTSPVALVSIFVRPPLFLLDLLWGCAASCHDRAAHTHRYLHL